MTRKTENMLTYDPIIQIKQVARHFALRVRLYKKAQISHQDRKMNLLYLNAKVYKLEILTLAT